MKTSFVNARVNNPLMQSLNATAFTVSLVPFNMLVVVLLVLKHFDASSGGPPPTQKERLVDLMAKSKLRKQFS